MLETRKLLSANAELCQWFRPLVFGICGIVLSIACTSCGTKSYAKYPFSRYVGRQGAWPTSDHVFVEKKKDGADVLRGLPNRPYEVIGFVQGTGTELKNAWGGKSPFSVDALKKISRVAKFNGADALILMNSERAFAGFQHFQSTFNSPARVFGSAYASGSTIHYDATVYGGNSTGWGYSQPVYEQRYSAVAIRYVDKFPDAEYLVDGKTMTIDELREYFYTTNPDLRGQELLVGEIMPWVISPNSQGSDIGAALKQVADKARASKERIAQNDISGPWYGSMDRTKFEAGGSSKPYTTYVSANFSRTKEKVVGRIHLITGEKFQIEGEVQGEMMKCTLTDLADGRQSSGSVTISPRELKGEISPAGQGKALGSSLVLHR